ncbi:hypothetical protein C6P45_004664 [Maudiozyma exigua]|uniref:RING-type domain-containing protein n=1 Tax=Maudiozyma exigua TaxID=34358 RepID=A0A9P6WCB4_MAUEX|nr:hypothetical protein C6P45_004664 [Kazachstania exigua]
MANDTGGNMPVDTFILDNGPIYETLFYYCMGYILSPFAMICFMTNLILNRVVVMTSVRKKNGNSKNQIKLPLWSRLIFHGGMIVLLYFALVQILCELGISNIFVTIFANNSTSDNFFMIRLLSILALSHMVETFMTTTSNTKSLSDFDYSLFEIALQFYLYIVSIKFRSSLSTNIQDKIHQQIMCDSLVAVTNNIVIHSLELFHLQNFRLIISFLTNIIHFIYTKNNILVILGTDRLYVTYLRLFFKLIPSLILTISIIFNALEFVLFKCLKWDTIKSVQFFDKIYSFYQINSNQEFLKFIMELSKVLLQSNDNENNQNHTKHLEELSITEDSYMISENHAGIFVSGYMNRLSTNPEDKQNIEILSGKNVNDSIVLNVPYCFIKLRWSADIFIQLLLSLIVQSKGLIVSLLIFLRLKKRADIVENPRDNKTATKYPHKHQDWRVRKIKDLNRLVTSHNYTKFLTRYALKNDSNQHIEQFELHKFLLPEVDMSPDFELPDDNDMDHNKFLKSQDKMAFIPTNMKEIKEELSQLFSDFNSRMMESTENLNWYNSMYSILKYELENDKECLTRSQYGALNNETILNEVVLERWTANEDAREHNHEEHLPGMEAFDDLNDSADEELDLVCVVCLQEVRNIVFWPCKCLAICDECRTALGSRGFKACVACNFEVEGYTKLNIV